VQTLENFEHVGSRGFYRPTGVMTLEAAIEIVAIGIECARKLELDDLLVNVYGLSGFEVPSTFARYELAVRWAKAGSGVLRLAAVVRPDFIDREKIGMVMAQNRGLDADVFADEKTAINWLNARAGMCP
jgi:hypothetical protein